MNTAKWGKPGWDLMGPAAERYDRHIKKKSTRSTRSARPFQIMDNYWLYLTILETQLPCKYCRASYYGYIRELPPDKYLYMPEADASAFGSTRLPTPRGAKCNFGCSAHSWMYQVHNKVNDKLRLQGYNEHPNPSPSQALKYVREVGKDLVQSSGWDFIHSIAHNYPEEPTIEHRVNTCMFMASLPYLLPHPALIDGALEFMKNNPVDNCLEDRPTLVLWCYLLHSHLVLIYRKLGAKGWSIRKFNDSCAYYESFRAGCGQSKGKKGGSCRLPVSASIKNRNLQLLLDNTRMRS